MENNKTNMNSIMKQCIINQINLPYDTKDIIKSFCFYDIKMWETIQNIRVKKEEINRIFKYRINSRATTPSEFYEDDDDDEHWVFWVDTPEDRDYMQFQGSNCKVCGNYVTIFAPYYISQKILCNCQHHNLYDLDDLTYHSDYTDYTVGTDW